MAKDDDPYRTLGLSRGASIEEVRRAYRRLAKANHPDVAGEKALPRFLAIQAAYLVIVGGGPRPASKSTTRPAAGPDADRADATRRAYGSRARRPRTSPAGSGGTSAGSGGTTSGGARPGAAPGPGARARTGSGSTRRAGTRPGTSSTPGSTPGSGTPDDGSGSAKSAKRARERKATLGSTSYDGVEGAPFEPDWGGASWYGTTSGTYWTLNPKEYADPRKHGPEYQARARRAAEAEARARDRQEPAAADPEPIVEPDPATGPPEPAGRPTHTTSSWWESTAGPVDDEPAVARSSPAGASAGPAPGPAGAPGGAGDAVIAPPPDVARALSDLARALLDERSGGWRGRLIRAAVGWLPLALGIGWVNGEVTGCSRFAASCDHGTDPFVLVAQLLLLGLLIAVPIVASLAAMASITLAGTAVVATLALSAAGSEADAESRRIAVGSLLVVGWLVGLIVGIVRRARDAPTVAPPAAPAATTGTTGTATAGPSGPADPARPVS